MRKVAMLQEIVERNSSFIPGGISSANRAIEPVVAFLEARGAYLWDSAGKRYIDFHAGFAPYFLGHNFQPVNQAAIEVLRGSDSLMGAGFSVCEGRLAELVCKHVPAAQKVVLVNTGSEATSLAVRIARACTQRLHVIVMQGGYNGNQDELACNVFNTLEEIGPRVSPGEYPLRPLGVGTVLQGAQFIHVVNFNDLESVEYVCRRHSVAALITEPVLQNIGVVKPLPGYLEGLRRLADQYGFVLIFDEVKTGFRQALGGYSALSGIQPDLVVFGKAIANGFPLALVGGRRELMDVIIDPVPGRRPFVAGTYNGHPVAVAAAIKTIEYLAEHGETVYPRVAALAARMERGIIDILARHKIVGCVPRQGSAFSFYFMPTEPQDFHAILENHDLQRDLAWRRALMARGIFFLPIATKQCSISAAHSPQDIEFALEQLDHVASIPG